MRHYLVFFSTLSIIFFAWQEAVIAQTYYSTDNLISTSKTVMDEDIIYPTTGKPLITMAIFTIEPGPTQASIHRHPAPLAAYILEGEVVIDYGNLGRKTFRKGDAFVEAMSVPHRGFNISDKPVKILGVYVGSEGTANVALEK